MKRYLLSRPLSKIEQELVFERWAYYKIDDELILAFSAPDNGLPNDIRVTEGGGASWADVSYIDSVPSKAVISSLLKKSLIVKCLQRGLKRDGNSSVIYFPAGLLERNRLKYLGYKGKMTRIDVVGERKALKARSHLGMVFSIRQDVVNGFAVLVKIALFLVDENNRAFDFKVALRKRKRITKNWWNHQWLSRHMAIRSFLADGTDVITIGEAGNSQVRLSSVPILGTLGVGIDESYLQPIRAKLVAEQDTEVDDSGDFETEI